MAIGIFLDVDITLTRGLIQRHYADKLGVASEYQEIERLLQIKEINVDEFGERLISLFNDAKFDDKFAETWFQAMPLQSWTEVILKLPRDYPVTLYLVSSGPSYYVQRLAKQFGIPEQNVLCSQYVFGKDGQLERCDAVSPTTKVGFVERFSNAHLVSIGIGDHAEFDGPFISNCDIPILTESKQGFLHLETLEVITTLVKKLSKKIKVVPRSKPAVLIASATEQLELTSALQSLLIDSCNPTPWKQVFRPTRTAIESLESALLDYDFAVFFIDPNDILSSRGDTFVVTRDNVIFELGMFIGNLGRKRCFMISPINEKHKLPSDLSGVTVLFYDAKTFDRAPADKRYDLIQSSLSKVSNEIKREIQLLGCRKNYL